jgi:hypothetical protein
VDETKVPPRKIKVVDRRKFTSDGDPLSDSPAPRAADAENESSPPTPDPQQQEVESGHKPTAPSPPKEKNGGPSPGFVELVVMLAGQAELLLVGAEGLPAQPVEAKRLIDCLGVLEAKTAGNLSDEESRVLSSVLYQLRSLYLQKSP